MGTTAIDSDDQQYACKCLNIRFRPSATHTVAADLEAEPDFTQLYVGDEGISIVHPQVTVRTRTRGVPIAGASRCFRFTTITCLVCDLLVYRVYQTYAADVDGKDGPILPTEDWVERDILKSSSGWIEIHKQCLTRDAISQALLSPQYCATFRLLLPFPTAAPLTNAEPMFEEPSSPYSLVPPSPSFPRLHFGHLRPVFLPPPFTPSHPVFAYFSSIASSHSEAVRAAAEQHINDLIQKKVSEIEHSDAELRLHVEALWTKFREGLSHFQDQNQATPQKQSTSRSADTNPARSVRDFAPDPVSPARSPSPSIPRISALSASLATSSFHHPRARVDQASHVARPSSPASNRSNGSTSSSTLILQPPQASEGNSTNVLKFKRNINESINTAASYRYFINLEEDMARHREHRQENETKPDLTDQNQGVSSSAHDRSNEEQKKQPFGSRSDAEHNSQTNTQVEEAPMSRGREKSKGKRKVTFDVEPAVVTIKRDVNAEKEEVNVVDNQDPREMIFELEDLDQETNESLVDSQSSLPLLEQPAQPLRSRKHRQSTELSGSFSTLRPASLPAPSHMRPPKSTHGADASSSTILLTIPRPSLSLKDARSPGSGTPSPTKPGDRHGLVNPRDVEILKLVAANTPSHRGAWKPNSKAWQTFVRRQDSRDHTGDGYIAEEGEEEIDENGSAPVSAPMRLPSSSTPNGNGSNGSDVTFVGSLPIPIKLARRPQALSLASYQPQTAVPDRSVAETAPARSTAALRKAVYAERDRSRSIDPGALDFEEDEETNPLSDEEDDVEQNNTFDAGDRGRNRALKILQAGSEVPEAGMWRSLTT